MLSLVESLKELTVANAKFLYDNFGIVFIMKAGELVGITKECK